MRHATALGLKFAAYLIIFGVCMPVFGFLPLSQAVVLAAVLTLLLWFGDLLILPRFGNRAATIVDTVVLILGSFRILSTMEAVPDFLSLVLAIPVAVAFEWWFHRWLFETEVID